MLRTIAPPRSCARISTSSTRSLVGSARSSLTISSAGPGPEHLAELGKAGECFAHRGRTGRSRARSPLASANGPAEIDATRSRSPSGHALRPRASAPAPPREVRRAEGSATATAGTNATNTEPVSAVRTRNASEPGGDAARPEPRRREADARLLRATRRPHRAAPAVRRRGARTAGNVPRHAPASSAQTRRRRTARASTFTRAARRFDELADTRAAWQRAIDALPRARAATRPSTRAAAPVRRARTSARRSAVARGSARPR